MMMANGIEKVELTGAYIRPLNEITEYASNTGNYGITQPWWNSYQLGVPSTAVPSNTPATVSTSNILGSALKQSWQDIGSAFAKPRSAANESSGGKEPPPPTGVLAEDPFADTASKTPTKQTKTKPTVSTGSANIVPKPITPITASSIATALPTATVPTATVAPASIATTQPLAVGATPITSPVNAPIIPAGLAASVLPQQPATIEAQIQQLTLENNQLKLLLASKTAPAATSVVPSTTPVAPTAVATTTTPATGKSPRKTSAEAEATPNTTAGFLPCGCPAPTGAVACGCPPSSSTNKWSNNTSITTLINNPSAPSS